jgi:hypothetical protein
MASHLPPSVRTAWLGLAGLIALTACSPSSSGGRTSAVCAKPLRGLRYAVCGHLSAVPSTTASSSGRQLQGTLDVVTPSGAAGGHEISGGSFHASH